MKISKLEITSCWKNLEGFSIDFNVEKDVVVVLGRNGSAKSNLLETLITIFRDIDLKNKSEFSYKIEYSIKNELVIVEAEANKVAKGRVKNSVISLSELRINWIPKYIVGYYSGVSDRFEALFKEHDKLALNETLHEIRPGEILTFRRFICARPSHGLYALLAFYLADDKVIDTFLKQYPRIETFDSALIVLKKPIWAKPSSSSSDFWGAKGPVGDLLQKIKNQSLAPFTRTVTIKTDFRRRETKELLYLFLPDLKALHSISTEYGGDPKAFFQALDTMRLSELLEDFRVRVKVKGASTSIHTRQLSEGEQQLLTVLGLMRFTQDEESLYILDEPDTHLNPAWGLDYLDHLRTIGGINQKSHTILATHDPLLVAGLLKEEIKILSRSESGSIAAIQPEDSPRGTGVAGVLTSELYGLESQLDNFSLKVLKRIYEVSFLENYPLKKRHLQRLRNIIPGLAATDTSPDPYRNIAKIAYKQAVDLVIHSSENLDFKIQAINNLSSLLYNEAKEKKDDLH